MISLSLNFGGIYRYSHYIILYYITYKQMMAMGWGNIFARSAAYCMIHSGGNSEQASKHWNGV
jgi:hypothetical protein